MLPTFGWPTFKLLPQVKSENLICFLKYANATQALVVVVVVAATAAAAAAEFVVNCVGGQPSEAFKVFLQLVSVLFIFFRLVS